MEKDLGISYPTVKGRLKNIIKTLGYHAGENNGTQQRMKILNDLSDGRIDIKDALKHLQDLK